MPETGRAKGKQRITTLTGLITISWVYYVPCPT